MDIINFEGALKILFYITPSYNFMDIMVKLKKSFLHFQYFILKVKMFNWFIYLAIGYIDYYLVN